MKSFDTSVLAAVRDGAYTYVIKNRLLFSGSIGTNSRKVLTALKRLEKSGHVRRGPRYTYSNSIYWEQT